MFDARATFVDPSMIGVVGGSLYETNKLRFPIILKNSECLGATVQYAHRYFR